MSDLEIVDTFPAFLSYWTAAREKAFEDQIELWAGEYLSYWPELLEAQIQDYSEQDLDWRQVAREKVFPFLQERLPAMQEARANLLSLAPGIFSKAGQILDFEASTCFVIHVGIGCGAGWVRPFENKESILFGLENIAECGWSDPEAIAGLVAHEVGHLAHFCIRAEDGKEPGNGPWWQLYTEGFAHSCERLLNDSYRQENRDDGWLTWCRQNKSRLASRFLQAAEEGQPVNPFFGSWLEIEGHSETGYFLGHELIQALVEGMSFQEIARLDDFEKYSRTILEEMTAQE